MASPALDFDRCYAAVAARDRRFDGQFVLAVRTTGIYCRPGCPARTPRAHNCVFLPTSAAAHQAGYRACRRCLPESVPGSPTWNVREDVAARAMRLIGQGVVDRDGVAGLAARLGYSERQLTRILTAELGAGPLALARAQRAQTARHLLVSTPMRMVDVAFASGFTSIRQFNDTIGAIYAMTPSAVRATAASRADAGPAGTLTVRLPAREPFGGAGVLAWMRHRAIAGLAMVDDSQASRALRLTRGAARVDLRPRPGHVSATVALEHLADLPELLSRLRRLFDVDADAVGIDAALAADPRIAPSVAAVPGVRIPGTVDPTEMLASAILGQQVTVTAARTAVQRLVDELGEPLPETLRTDDVNVQFPTASSIATHAADVVRGPRSRVRALTVAMAALASGDVVLDEAGTLHDTTRALEALPGIGPWTSHYVAMRVLGHPDVLLPGDSALRAGARALGLPDDARGLTAHAERHRPWRSYLMIHLWRAATSLPKEA